MYVMYILMIFVGDYVHMLHACTKSISTLGQSAMLYLAAAVSDFYIPSSAMVFLCLTDRTYCVFDIFITYVYLFISQPEHKIQSSDGRLSLTLELVPKLLKPLVSTWAASCFVVSFKLETDPTLLEGKSRRALQHYGHQVVVGNVLTTRKREVWLYTAEEGADGKHLVVGDSEQRELEELIVEDLVSRHRRFISA